MKTAKADRTDKSEPPNLPLASHVRGQATMDAERYRRALLRNLYEAQRAVLERSTLTGIEKAGPIRCIFIRLAYDALLNDYIAHCIKIFERGSRAASFWTIYRADEQAVNDFTLSRRIDLKKLELVSEKLKLIRNKTHFHIDGERVFDPKAVWKDAGLRGKELSWALDGVWAILNHLHVLNGGKELEWPAYDEEAALRSVRKLQY